MSEFAFEPILNCYRDSQKSRKCERIEGGVPSMSSSKYSSLIALRSCKLNFRSSLESKSSMDCVSCGEAALCGVALPLSSIVSCNMSIQSYLFLAGTYSWQVQNNQIVVIILNNVSPASNALLNLMSMSIRYTRYLNVI